MLWGVFALKCFVFPKFAFSRFSIHRICCSIDPKCNKKLGLILPGSIGSQLMLDRSNLIFDWLNLFFDWPKTGQRVKKKSFSQVFITLFILFQKAFSLFFFDRSTSSQFFCHFLPNFSQGFCLQVLIRPFYPFFFILFTIFMHFRWNFQTYRFLGFLIFELVSFKFDHWVFVLRCCKHVSYALIWLIWWFENNLKF